MATTATTAKCYRGYRCRACGRYVRTLTEMQERCPKGTGTQSHQVDMVIIFDRRALSVEHKEA